MSAVQIETCELTEQTVDPDGNVAIESDSRAIELIEKMELDGQKALVHPETGDTPETRMPFKTMNRIERAVYEAVCPTRVKIGNFRAEPIPTRVLEVADKYRHMFRELEIWSSDPTIPDPLLVGVTWEEGATWDKSYHLMARWGAELAPFAELKDKAVSTLRTRYRSLATRIKNQASSFLDSLDASDDNSLLTTSEPTAFGLDLR